MLNWMQMDKEKNMIEGAKLYPELMNEKSNKKAQEDKDVETQNKANIDSGSSDDFLKVLLFSGPLSYNIAQPIEDGGAARSGNGATPLIDQNVTQMKGPDLTAQAVAIPSSTAILMAVPVVSINGAMTLVITTHTLIVPAVTALKTVALMPIVF
ncbi:hypothetical protein NDU88_005369 [Pleurodeles waltl]|uniref:Uncharacterized protein n=1 Tax=Pleurodeles waltl TaxID=8319 RepID=A0AAV7SLG7_PLEWA|nr:hypothetical protein NDU88_005369 [Pleurodeles waltl]